MGSFWFISTSTCLQSFNIGNSLVIIREIVDFSDIRAILGRVITIRDNSESKLQTFCPDFIFDIMNDTFYNCLNLGNLSAHRSSCIKAEANINKPKRWNLKVISWACFKLSGFFRLIAQSTSTSGRDWSWTHYYLWFWTNWSLGSFTTFFLSR